MPYIIVTASEGTENDIYLERFILVNSSKEEPVLLSLRTRMKSKKIALIDDPAFGLTKLLEHEVLLAKQHFLGWLYDQIKEQAFVQNQQLKWEEIIEIMPLALICASSQKANEKIEHVANSTCCEELAKFLNNVFNLRLIIGSETI
jgi:hypothetical protein